MAESCLGDLNADRTVTGADLGILLGQWGQAGSGDLNGDGIVGGADLGLLLGVWGRNLEGQCNGPTDLGPCSAIAGSASTHNATAGQTRIAKFFMMYPWWCE